jgi:hypothetical protein
LYNQAEAAVQLIRDEMHPIVPGQGLIDANVKGTSAGSTVPRHVLKKTPSPRDMEGRGYEGKILLIHVFTCIVY